MNICVFCSSGQELEQKYYKLAYEAGNAIGKFGHGLVYGGTNVGMMKSVADGARENGAKVTGVIPKVISNTGIQDKTCDVLHETESMSERKAYMSDISDVFIALPGGFGTLEELSEVITSKHLGVHNKAIVVLNHDGFYNQLISWFDILYAEKFANESYRKAFYIAQTVEDAMAYITNYKTYSAPLKY